MEKLIILFIKKYYEAIKLFNKILNLFILFNVPMIKTTTSPWATPGWTMLEI